MYFGKKSIFILLCLIIYSCKESVLIYRFETDDDVLLREFVRDGYGKEFYVYSSEKDVYVVTYFEVNIPINLSENIGYWELSNDVRISVLSEDIVKEIHDQLLLVGKLKTGGVVIVKFHPNGKIEMEKGQ